jgi:hypothetical protein
VLGVALAVPGGRAAGAGAPQNSIQLAARTPWVTADNAYFRLVVSIQSPLPESDLELSLQLYPEVTSRSEFKASLTAPVAPVQEAQLIPLTTFGDAKTSGTTTLSIPMDLPVTTGESPVATQSPTAPTLTLECDLRTPQPCDGVYPLQVALVNRLDVALSSFTTYLVNDIQPFGDALPLRVGWILPLGGSPMLGPGGAPSLDPTDEAAIADTVQQLDAYPTVGVTVQTYGETVLAIASATDAASRRLAAQLRTLTASPSHEIVGATFAPVDVVEFAHAGLAGELAEQLKVGAETLRAALSQGVALPSDPWVVDAPVDTDTLTMLAATGVQDVVLPEQDLAADSWLFTPTEPFSLSVPGAGGATTTLDAISADPELPTHFTDSSDQVLAAENLLADLAMIYFEEPYARAPTKSGSFVYQPRSVAMETPAGWQTNATMLRVLLEGLKEAQEDGILQPSTVSGLFAGDPPGADTEPATRTLTASAASLVVPTDGATSQQVATARSDIAAFSSLVPSDVTETAALQDDVLGGEASDLTPADTAALLGLPRAQIAAAGSLITLPQGPIVDLTSSTGQIPITIESTSKVPLDVRLVLSSPSPGLHFPSGSSIPLVISRKTTVEDVKVGSSTSGDFALRLALVTPEGAVPVARGNVTLRSTAISGIAIGLSAGALALLFVWWIRSSRRRRRSLRAAPPDEGDAPGDSDGPEPVPVGAGPAPDPPAAWTSGQPDA